MSQDEERVWPSHAGLDVDTAPDAVWNLTSLDQTTLIASTQRRSRFSA